MSKKITAIGVTADKKFYKYKYVYNTPRSINTFEKFMKTKGVIYINYYENGRFIKRNNIQSE